MYLWGSTTQINWNLSWNSRYEIVLFKMLEAYETTSAVVQTHRHVYACVYMCVSVYYKSIIQQTVNQLGQLEKEKETNSVLLSVTKSGSSH